ncbi:MAG: hypothetical protein WCE52_10565, partial [Candidatus Acidiferrum sp.]
MAHFTLIARINSGDGRFPFVNVQFSKNHRPLPIVGATYYLRPTSGDRRTPMKIGKDDAASFKRLKQTTRCQSVFDFHSPWAFFQSRRVATDRL